MSKVFEYFKQVGGAFGPSGREDDVREVIGAMAGDLCDDIQTDALGNVTEYEYNGNGSGLQGGRRRDGNRIFL